MKWALSIAVLAGSLLSSSVTRAEPELTSAALRELIPYDLDGERTTQALSVLRAEGRTVASSKRREELAFMRAVALSDLWVIARATGREGLEKRVATSLGVEPAAVAQTLDAELATVDSKVVSDVVADARQAVRMAQGTPTNTSAGFGVRSQALFLSRVTGALGNSTDGRENVTRLSKLADDPCPQLNDSCAPLYRTFERTGRQAIHALVLASSARKALESGAQDPFVVAMEGTIESQGRALSSVMLQPNVRLPQAQSRVHASPAGADEAPDLLVLVAEDRVEYAFLPRVRVDDNGQVVLDQSAQPAFPALAQVKLEGTFAPFVRPIEGVVTALRSLREKFPSARVAVGGAPEIKGHMIARTLLSAQSAGFSELSLLGANPEGELRSVGLELVGALHASEVGPREVSVVVRLGGFSVKRAGPTVTIPRLKQENGFVFDFESLLTQARPAQAKSAKLTFMSDVAAATLTEAAFLMAPAHQTLTVVLP
ncbi:MAG: hypothetical protein QM778_08030 [Myxococcales bacterium]